MTAVKIRYLIPILLLVAIIGRAQPAALFARGIYDSLPTGRSNGLVLDASGNSYITGRYTGMMDFDLSNSTGSITAAGLGDIFVAKYNASGIYQWAISLGGALEDEGKSISLDALGNILVTGRFEGIADFDPSSNTSTLSSFGSGDIFLAKYNSNGIYQWAIAVGSLSDDAGFGVSTDNQGNCFITGFYSGATDFDPSASSFTLPSTGKDIFAAKYDPIGQFQWAFHIDGDTADIATGIKCDLAGNCFITGSFGSGADFDPSINSTILTTPANKNNAFLAKYDNNGNYQWAFGINSTFFNQSNALALDTTGNVFITGFIWGSGLTADFDPSMNSATLSAAYNSAFVAKYSGSGIYQWAFLLKDGSINRGNAISTDITGNCYVTGLYSLLCDFDPSPAVSNLIAAGLEYVFVAKYSSNGIYQWAFRLGNVFPYDSRQGISNDISGNTYVTGQMIQSPFYLDFDPTAGTYPLSNANIFVAKYDICGAPSPPTIITPTSNLFICTNTSTTLSAIGTGTINWFAASNATSAIATGTIMSTPVLSAGVYTYYAAASTCTTNIFNAIVTVTVNPLPVINILNPTPIICSGQNIALSATGANTYTWNNQLSSSMIIVNPTVNSNYTVTGSDVNNCMASAVTGVTVDACIAIKDLFEENDFSIYPLPAKDELTVEWNHKHGILTVLVMNDLGQILKEMMFDSSDDKKIIDTRDLQNGLYILSLNAIASNEIKYSGKTNSNTRIHKRFVIDR